MLKYGGESAKRLVAYSNSALVRGLALASALKLQLQLLRACLPSCLLLRDLERLCAQDMGKLTKLEREAKTTNKTTRNSADIHGHA